MDAVVKDADARNKTFMDLIRERMKLLWKEMLIETNSVMA